jgi:hypothetical protein
MLNSIANSAQFGWKLAGLTAILRANPNWLPGFFSLLYIIIYFFRNESIEKHARAFFKVIILSIACVTLVIPILQVKIC